MASKQSTTTGSEEQAAERAPRKRRVWLRVLVNAFLLVVVAVGVVAGLYAWDRWYRYDDAADFRGTWYPVGSLSAVEIGEDSIAFSEDTAYSYSLDVRDKTVTYSLGNMKGGGHYWFAEDRSVLVIEDGEEFTAAGTAFHDFTRLVASLGKDKVELPQGDGVSVFTRAVDPDLVIARDEAERQAKLAEEAARKAEEEAARAEQAEEQLDSQPESGNAEGEGGESDVGASGRGEEGDGGGQGTEGSGAAKGAEEQPKDFASESMGIFEKR